MEHLIPRPAWVEIDLDNLRFNLTQIKEKVNGARILGVVKADAYGHGMLRVATVMAQEGITDFAVATPQEALTLREAGFADEILVLGLVDKAHTAPLLTAGISLVTDNFADAKVLSEQALSQGVMAKVYIAVDTGMGRIGYLSDDAAAVQEVVDMTELPNFFVQGLISHFATADSADKSFAKEQADRYAAFLSALESAGVDLKTKTLANSAAIMEMPETLYDAVRPGIIQYGCYPSDEVDASLLDLKPVMSVHAHIAKIKKVPVGYSCGYGQKFIAERESIIATLPIGYADGYPRAFSSVAKVVVNGHLAPIAGNICMDQCMVDITDVPDVSVGDKAIIMGTDLRSGLSVTAEEIAGACGTINYEILCDFGMRLPKIYIEK